MSGPASTKVLTFPYCHEVVKYEKVAKIGQGTFGCVKV